MKLRIQRWWHRLRDAIQVRKSLTSDTYTPSQMRTMLFAAGATGIILFLLTYYARTWQSLTDVVNICPNQFCDFIEYYYPMGETIFKTGIPVEGFLYSPFIAILLSVFPLLGLNASLVLWGILQVLFVSLYVLLLHRLLPVRLSIQLFFIILILSSYPLLLNLMGGQVSVFITVAIFSLLVVNERGNRVAGASLLAFAVSFKFYPLIFIAPFAARRDIRFLLLATAACGAIFFVIPGLLLGFDGTLRFYGALFDSFRNSAWVEINPHSQFFPHLFSRLTGSIAYAMQMYFPLLHWISFGVAAVNMVLIFLVQRARFPYADLWSFQLVFMSIPFVLKTSWPHDFVFLPFTQAFLVWWLLEGEKFAMKNNTAGDNSQVCAWRGEHSQAANNLMFIFIILSIVLSNVVFFNIIGSFPVYSFCGFLFWSNLFLLITSYWILLPPSLRGFFRKDIENNSYSTLKHSERISGGSIK